MTPSSPPTSIPADPREQLALIVDCSSDAVYASDLDGRIMVWNRSAERLYGYSRGEAIGRSVSELVPDERADEHRVVMEAVLQRERVEHYETEQRGRDGRRVEVSLTVSAIHAPDGKPWGVSTFARDIGERRAMERELARTRAELERHAGELERSNADLEQFAYVASHDLSEPLRAISGMLDLLREEYGATLDEDATEYVDRSVAAARRLRRLIEALLGYSRIGRADVVPEAVDCQELVDDIARDITASRPEASADVCATGLPTVIADAGQLRRLLENLIANGLKFNDSDQPRVTVRAEEETGRWRFAVEDNGIGIPPEHANRVFQVFKRLHARDAYDGTGIGLAVCRRIVERHGGEISVAPGSAGGSAFAFTIFRPGASS